MLSRHGVEFVIIGAFAAELHAAPIPRTQDVDVTPKASQENLARLSAALQELEPGCARQRCRKACRFPMMRRPWPGRACGT